MIERVETEWGYRPSWTIFPGATDPIRPVAPA